MKNYLLSFLFTLAVIGNVFSQDFYDINTIRTIEITFEESNWDQIMDQNVSDGNEERLIGSISIDGQFFDSVGVRYKGNSSYNANQVKNPLNIKLDYILDQDIEGYGTLKLSNVYKDPSFVREVLGYEIARKYMPAGLANYANVYINETHLGLYSNVQDVDKFFMRNHFESDENARIKGELLEGLPPNQMGGVWEYFDDDSSSYFSKYALESDFGWNELVDFLDTLNNHTDYTHHVLNIDRHLWFLAYSNLLVNLDGPINNPQNYYIYKDDSGRFNPIPWDLNECFGVFSFLQSNDFPLNTSQLQNLDPFVNSNNSEYPNISEILDNETYKQMYIAHMKTILEENFSEGDYETRALEIQEIIDQDVQDDDEKFYSYTDFINNLDNSIGVGPNSVIGITQLMDERVDYIEGHSDFQYEGPQIENVNNSPLLVDPNSEVWFNATVSNANAVFLAYRSNRYGPFTKVLMFDDGMNEDGAAGDNIYGVSIDVAYSDIQYYIYAENDDAVSFSPVRAEYEFYSIEITGNLVINEFMADNENTAADQDGEFDDWIEFYNNGNESILLNGYFLSDDPSEVDKWAFPDTSISAGDYMIVWADKDEDQEGLHANFKLSSSGESVIISDSNHTIIDDVYFLEQKEDTSTGRYINGTGNFIEMLPTFESENSNLITSINELEHDEKMFFLLQNHPNPFHSSTTISFYLEESNTVTLSIYNAYGLVVETLLNTSLSEGEHSYVWNANAYAKGLYFYALKVGKTQEVKKMILQ